MLFRQRERPGRNPPPGECRLPPTGKETFLPGGLNPPPKAVWTMGLHRHLIRRSAGKRPRRTHGREAIHRMPAPGAPIPEREAGRRRMPGGRSPHPGAVLTRRRSRTSPYIRTRDMALVHNRIRPGKIRLRPRTPGQTLRFAWMSRMRPDCLRTAPPLAELPAAGAAAKHGTTISSPPYRRNRLFPPGRCSRYSPWKNLPPTMR